MDKALTTPGWISVAEAARMMGVTPEAVIELIRSGELKGYFFAPQTETTH